MGHGVGQGQQNGQRRTLGDRRCLITCYAIQAIFECFAAGESKQMACGGGHGEETNSGVAKEEEVRLLGKKLYQLGNGGKAYSLYLRGNSKGFVWICLSVRRCGKLTFAVKDLKESTSGNRGKTAPSE